jgi:hypothetical protein
VASKASTGWRLGGATQTTARQLRTMHVKGCDARILLEDCSRAVALQQHRFASTHRTLALPQECHLLVRAGSTTQRQLAQQLALDLR